VYLSMTVFSHDQFVRMIARTLSYLLIV